MITTAQGFAGSLLCALALFVCLFSNINKNEMWGRTMWFSAALYGITGFLFALNPYVVPDLHPPQCFLATTCLMLNGVAVSYIRTLFNRLNLAVDIERQTLLAGRIMTFRVLGFGLGWIIVVTPLIAFFGVAEQSTDLSPTFGKQLTELKQSINLVFAQLVLLDKKGDRRDARLDKIEQEARKKEKVDLDRFDRLEKNQNKLLKGNRSIESGQKSDRLRPTFNVIQPTPRPAQIPTNTPSLEDRVIPVTVPPYRKGRRSAFVNEWDDTELWARDYERNER